ncbi:hypothetical protein BKA63DRAFT_506347 [Paraphoma chrysanthemicola]|nr:hypothetical protein BKA63DRAFT_506347 [Paraphoma chrysanthemicola]
MTQHDYVWLHDGRDYHRLAQAVAAKEQPRNALNEQDRRKLPHANPLRQQQCLLLQMLSLDCRLLIWEYILQTPQTRIERWRPTDRAPFVMLEDCDADCFPFRLRTGGWEKTEKPLNLLLCCRQLYLEGLSVLYTTRFVFEKPLELYAFQKFICPEGVSNVRRIVIAFGNIGNPFDSPLFSDSERHVYGSLEEWENAIRGLKNMIRLQELQVWLGHGHVQMPHLERRPWKDARGDDSIEKRHQKLFDLFGTVDVPRFTLHLTWRPEDVFAQRQWPFEVELHTRDEMFHILNHDLLEMTESDIYVW